MAMAVKSSLVYAGIGMQTMPECWSSSLESLNSDSWEWNNEEPSTRSGWASVTVASSAGGSQSDEFSPVYVSAPSVESVKNEPASCLFSLGRDDEESPDKGNGKLGRSLEKADESLGSPPPGKKQRPLLPCITTLVPRCQVEGCKADLSGCKDYHKRHKVCEMHSKAPKAIAGGIEQRFCQQCSRFHLLKEFDEGKRSCRRRLAGHNQRRRKPHPEPHSFLGLGNPFLHREISTSTLSGAPFHFPEDVKPSSVLHPHRSSLLEFNGLHSYGHSLTRATPWSLKTRNDSIPTFQIQNPKTPMTILKPTPCLNLGGHPHHFLEGSSLGPLGQGLSLSSSTGGVLGSLEQQSPMESLSSAMDSGRALSLLSLQSWAPPRGPPASSAQAAPPGDSTLEHLVASSNESSTRFSHPPCSSTTTTRAQPFSIQSGGLDSGGLTFGPTATGTGTHEQRGGCNNNMLAGLGGGYHEANSMLALVHGGQALYNNAGFGSSHQGRATMDLMQTVHSNGVYNNNNSNSSFSSVRAFESSRFSNQQLL